MRFALLFPQVAERETRTMKVFEALPATDPRHVPVDEYGFDELYCTERGCDCRRVMINVLARHARQHVATINHAFEKPAKEEIVSEQTFLDPLNRQSKSAGGLLDLFVNVVLADEQYHQRLLRHYRMFKEVVEDLRHPAHQLLHSPHAGAVPAAGPSRSKRSPLRAKRKRWK